MDNKTQLSLKYRKIKSVLLTKLKLRWNLKNFKTNSLKLTNLLKSTSSCSASLQHAALSLVRTLYSQTFRNRDSNNFLRWITLFKVVNTKARNSMLKILCTIFSRSTNWHWRLICLRYSNSMFSIWMIGEPYLTSCKWWTKKSEMRTWHPYKRFKRKPDACSWKN